MIQGEALTKDLAAVFRIGLPTRIEISRGRRVLHDPEITLVKAEEVRHNGEDPKLPEIIGLNHEPPRDFQTKRRQND